jgi:hypothetical protein
MATMANAEEAIALYNQGFNCAQALLSVCARLRTRPRCGAECSRTGLASSFFEANLYLLFAYMRV